jgi:hypothetical protein
MQDVSPVSASNEIVASFQSERCVSERWRAWSDAPHGGTSTSSVTFVETGETSESKGAAGVAPETSDGRKEDRRVVPSRRAEHQDQGAVSV